MKKEIRINPTTLTAYKDGDNVGKNTEIVKITAAIKEAEGRATARTITYRDVLDAIIEVETKLNVARKYLDGVSFRCDPNAQRFSSAYKYMPDSTHISLVYSKGAWRLTNIVRCKCNNPSEKYRTNLPGATIDAIINNYHYFEA